LSFDPGQPPAPGVGPAVRAPRLLFLLHRRVTIRWCAHTPATTTRGGGYESHTREGRTAHGHRGRRDRAQPPLTVVHDPPCLCVQFCPGTARTHSLCFPAPLSSSEALHSLGPRLRRGQHSLSETVLDNPGGGHKGHMCPGLPRQCWASEHTSVSRTVAWMGREWRDDEGDGRQWWRSRRCR